MIVAMTLAILALVFYPVGMALADTDFFDEDSKIKHGIFVIGISFASLGAMLVLLTQYHGTSPIFPTALFLLVMVLLDFARLARLMWFVDDSTLVFYALLLIRYIVIPPVLAIPINALGT